jgi:NAD(P)-dependent dehydrogenase (short-subunit alcohol dehydrogenase family)
MEDWARSVHVNAIGQLQLLHALYPHGASEGTKKVGFLVGGGINGPFRNYSAYCLGKVSLVKMCELLDDEYADIHAVAVGTGWVRTKIHDQTVAAGTKAGINLDRTLEFQRSNENGTPCEDIFECLEWCFTQNRSVTGGRNFSVVHDGWKEGGVLSAELEADGNKYKLRRHGNEPAQK